MGSTATQGADEANHKFSARKHVQLSKALEVLNLKPTSFHAIQAKPDKLKIFLEKALKTRTADFRIEQAELRYFEADSDADEGDDVDLNKVTDESTIHEGIFQRYTCTWVYRF